MPPPTAPAAYLAAPLRVSPRSEVSRWSICRIGRGCVGHWSPRSLNKRGSRASAGGPDRRNVVAGHYCGALGKNGLAMWAWVTLRRSHHGGSDVVVGPLLSPAHSNALYGLGRAGGLRSISVQALKPSDRYACQPADRGCSSPPRHVSPQPQPPSRSLLTRKPPPPEVLLIPEVPARTKSKKKQKKRTPVRRHQIDARGSRRIKDTEVKKNTKKKPVRRRRI